MDLNSAIAAIKAHARSLGFDAVGIAPTQPSVRADYVRRWLDAGHHGTMAYLANRLDERLDSGVFLPGAKSAVCLAIHYDAHPGSSGAGKIARYARGRDYHVVVKDLLKQLADFIRATIPGTQTKIGVDTVPVLERELAARAGIGWVGKNTMIIHPDRGSWMLLAEVLTTADLFSDTPLDDHCGNCRKCLDACPTQALAPYEINATRCIAYWTIEHTGTNVSDVPPDIAENLSGWIFGCDICQEVCPWNGPTRPIPNAQVAELRPRDGQDRFDPAEVLDWTLDQYHQRTRHTPLRRVKLPVLQRTARLLLADAESSSAK